MISLVKNDPKIRRFLLITLSHTETRNITKEEVSKRIIQTFACRSVIVAQEKHQATEKHLPLGVHFHIAVLNDNASRNSATSIIRKLFPEFEGRQCEVTFHKGWNTICAYVSKEDENPHVWGEYSLEEIRRIGQNVRKKVKNARVLNSELIHQLSECKEWLHVYNQPDLANQLLHKYNNMRRIHEDQQILLMQQSSFAERIVCYLNQKGWPQEYLPEEILEKYVLLDWIACQLAFHRPIKTKQLFFYGEPNTQKTLILHFLAKAMRIYFVSSRINDFAEADNYYDLWVFDEFYDGRFEETQFNANETHRVNTLLKVLDGQECRLDSKYGKIFKKNRNVPIIMIANELPREVKKHGPMRERFLRLRSQSRIEHLEEGRILATLWGCFFRRINRQFSFLPEKLPNMVDIPIQYNSVTAIIEPQNNPLLGLEEVKDRFNDLFTKKEGLMKGIPSLGRLGEKEGKKGYPYLDLNLLEILLETIELSLIQFAFIPILKREGNTEIINQTLQRFKGRKEGTSFRILRNTADYDYLVWPVYMTPIQTTISGEAEESSPENEKPKENKNGKEKEWPVKLQLWMGPCVNHMRHSVTLEAPAEPKPLGFWKLSLGVPPAEYNGDWGESD